MRAIFCGNFDFEARQSDLERLFRKYGRVDRVDMKSGFAFVYMDDERDAEDAIRGLDRIEFGRKGRRLRVEWTKQERGSRRIESSKKPAANTRPTKTLFVINFDPYHTTTTDLRRHFDLYGKIINIRIRKNFAFIQFESQEEATKALEATNMSKLMDRVITVEYAIKDDDERRDVYSPDRTRDRSPRRGYDRGGPPSPYGRERGSPDYGHGRGHGRSPSPYRGKGRASPDYGRGPRRHSPSPNRRGRNPDYGRGRSPSPRKERDLRYSHDQIASPPRRERAGVENGRGTSPPERVSPVYARVSSPVEGRESISPGEYRRSRSPDARPGKFERYNGEESPAPVGYRSRSPPARERSRS